jgi:hypothetical protein
LKEFIVHQKMKELVGTLDYGFDANENLVDGYSGLMFAIQELQNDHSDPLKKLLKSQRFADGWNTISGSKTRPLKVLKKYDMDVMKFLKYLNDMFQCTFKGTIVTTMLRIAGPITQVHQTYIETNKIDFAPLLNAVPTLEFHVGIIELRQQVDSMKTTLETNCFENDVLEPLERARDKYDGGNVLLPTTLTKKAFNRMFVPKIQNQVTQTTTQSNKALEKQYQQENDPEMLKVDRVKLNEMNLILAFTGFAVMFCFVLYFY